MDDDICFAFVQDRNAVFSAWEETSLPFRWGFVANSECLARYSGFPVTQLRALGESIGKPIVMILAYGMLYTVYFIVCNAGDYRVGET